MAVSSENKIHLNMEYTLHIPLTYIYIYINDLMKLLYYIYIGAYWSSGWNFGFWIQRLTVQILTSACCVREQDTLLALLQSTQL